MTKGACTAMSQAQSRSQPILTSVAAHLYVRDMKASAEFFTGNSASSSTFSMAIRRSTQR